MLIEFVRRLRARSGEKIYSVILYGSKARGDYTSGSDLDVLIVVHSDDWRVHKQIRYVAADILLEYAEHDVYLAPHVWSVSHLREMEQRQPSIYRNIQRDGIDLLSYTSSRTPATPRISSNHKPQASLTCKRNA